MVTRNTEWVYFQGKGSWFGRLIEGDDKFENWNIMLHFTDKSYADFMKLKEMDGDYEGIKNEIKKDEDGYYHYFKRPYFKEFKRGQKDPLQPPLVLNSEGQPWDRRVPIGNGSDITVKCELYKYNFRGNKKGKALRLHSVMINNFVPYTKDNFTDEQKKQAQGLDEQPRHLF